MEKERFRQIGTAHLFLVKANKILLLRRFNTGYEDGKYSVVAGHIDENETARQSMIREAKEEAGIEIKPEDLGVAHIMHRKGRSSGNERIDFFFVANQWAGAPKNLEPHKCDDMKWSELDKLPDNTIPYIKKAVGCFLNNELYSEHGWESNK
jgi:8-oxo-dGTP diphosphatase